jgi:CRISPR-associated protein Cst1
MNNNIKLFPSNWLYNAGVIGFLKVMASELGNSTVEKWLNDDGTVDIDRSVFDYELIGKEKIPKSLKYLIEYIVSDDDVREWKQKEDSKGILNKEKYIKFRNLMGDFGYKFIRGGNKLFQSKCPYQNLVQTEEWQDFEFANIVASFKDYLLLNNEEICYCDLCGNKTNLPDTNSKLEIRLNKFQEPLLRYLAPSTSYPNSFWNLNDSMYICHFCAYLVIHHHLAFTFVNGGDMFINAPSFKLMWYLNKSTEVLFSTNNLKEILGIRLIKLSQKINKALGVWSLMNIEMIIKSEKEINYYFLSPNISALLLNNNIASLITKANEQLILNMVLEEKFDELLELNYRLIRYISTTNKEKLDETDSYIKDIYNKNPDHLLELIKILPELYVKIKEKE